MATVSLSYCNTFNVYDYVTQVRIGQIALKSGGDWAAYRASINGNRIAKTSIGTYPDAEIAIRNLKDDFKSRKNARRAA